MIDFDDLHDRSMAAADQADAFRLQGNAAEAARLYRVAFEIEREAANATAAMIEFEPTRSILHRSAASLAMELKEYREAEILIARALCGNPPSDIATELRELWEQTSFGMHLRLRDFELAENQLVVSMWGQSVGYGFASCDQVLNRIESTQKLLYRTAERVTSQPYREQGDVPPVIRENFHVWASVAQAASYAFVFRVGGREAQGSLFDSPRAEKVVDEVMDCMSLASNHQYLQIQRRMASVPYFRNFIGLTSLIAPKGKEVSTVGFASKSGKKFREVVVVRPRQGRNRGMPLFSKTSPRTQHESVRISGMLLFASSLKSGTGREIAVVDREGVSHNFIVPRGLMADVVRPYFEKVVTIIGTRRKDVLVLQSISEFQDDDSARK